MHRYCTVVNVVSWMVAAAFSTFIKVVALKKALE